MNCPYCNKEVYGLTGLQELQKFNKHLRKCKKYPDRVVIPASIDESGQLQKPVNATSVSLLDALEIRANSGQ